MSERCTVGNDGSWTIRPLKFQWSEWAEKTRVMELAFAAVVKRLGSVGAVEYLTDWQIRLDGWLQAMDAEKQEDVVDLLLAESDLLFELIDPSHGPQGVKSWKQPSDSDAGMEFRERFYVGRPLAVAVARVQLPRHETVTREWQQLETHAEERQWLP